MKKKKMLKEIKKAVKPKCENLDIMIVLHILLIMVTLLTGLIIAQAVR